MALAGTDRGTGTHNTSALTFTLSPGSNFTEGALAVLCLSVNNADSSGTAHSTFTVTDTLGNTWTRRTSPIYDPGAANAGVEGAIFTSPMNGGTLTTGTVITVTFDVATVAKVWTLMEVTATSGSIAVYQAQGVGTGSATASPTVTTSSLTNGDMVIGMVNNEYGTQQTPTGDGDTTNGSWSTMQTTEIGSSEAGVSIITQRKVVTATATQTYNPTLGTSSDCIASWISLRETSRGSADGTLALTLGALVLAATGIVGLFAYGDLSATLGALTSSATGAVEVQGSYGSSGGGATLVQSSGKKNGNWSATSTTENAASNFTVGNTVIVSMAFYSANVDMSSVVIAGTTATRAIRAPASWGNSETASVIYYAKIANSGRTDVVLNTAGDSNLKIHTLSIEEWSGIQDSPLDKAVAAGPTTSTAPTATSGTLTTADQVVYFVCAYYNTVQSSITNPTDYTSLWEELAGTTNTGGEGYYRIVTATTSQAPQATLAASDLWTAAVATFKANSPAQLLGDLTLSATGTVGSAGADGTLNATLDQATLSGVGVVDVAGVATPTLGTLTLSSAGVVDVVGTSAPTLGTLTLSGAGAVDAVGTSTPTLGDLTLSATGTVGSTEIIGDLSVTLGALTVSSAVLVDVVGTATPTLGALTLSGAGVTDVVGTATSTLGTLTLSGAGAVDVVGTATPTLGTLTLSATGTTGGTTGSLSSTLGALTASAIGAANYAPYVGGVASKALPFSTPNDATIETDPAVTTQASGSGMVVGVARATSTAGVAVTGKLSGAADGNTYTQLGSHVVYTDWPTWCNQTYVSLNASGGSSHRWQADIVDDDEATIFGVEAIGGLWVQDYEHSEQAAASVVTSPDVITTQDALLISFWWGTAGAGDNSDHQADPSAGSGWERLDAELSMFGGASAIQGAVAYKRVGGAGTKSGCPWEGRYDSGPELNQGAITWTIAIQKLGGGDLAQALSALTLSGTGTIAVAGTATPTLGALTLSSVGTADVVGTATPTLGTLTLSADGVVGAAPVVGDLSSTLGAMTLSGTGIIPADGTASPALSALTLSGTGTIAVAGTATPTLGTLTLSSVGTADVVGTATPTLGTLTLSADGVVGATPAVGDLSSTLGAMTLSGTGIIPADGTATPALASLVLSGAGTITVDGAATPTLGTLALSGTGTVPAVGTLAVTLDPVLLSTQTDGRVILAAVSLVNYSAAVSRATYSAEVSSESYSAEVSE